MSDALNIYSNSIHVAVSLYEFTIGFRLQTPGEDVPPEGKVLAWVRMSPQQAKALHLLLGRQLEFYREHFSEILLPEDLVTRLTHGEEEESTE